MANSHFLKVIISDKNYSQIATNIILGFTSKKFEGLIC